MTIDNALRRGRAADEVLFSVGLRRTIRGKVSHDTM